MRFMGNGITSCYPDEVDNFISITVLRLLVSLVSAIGVLVVNSKVDLLTGQVSALQALLVTHP